MPVLYNLTTKTRRMQAVVDDIGPNGKLKLFTGADVLLATFPLAAVAGTVSGVVLTFSDANGAAAGILNTTASAAGVAAKATVTTSADVDIITGLTVGTSAADLIVNDTNLSISQAVTITAATISHA